MKEYGIRYQVSDREGRAIERQKFFSSQKALDRWVEKQERDNERWIGILAYLA